MKILINFLFFTLFISADLIAQYDLSPQARTLFDDQKYSVSQSIFRGIATSKSAYTSAEAMLLNARCSKELFLSDAKHLYEELIQDPAYYEVSEEVNTDLALIYYRNKQYAKAIDQFLKLEELSNEFVLSSLIQTFRLIRLKKLNIIFLS